MIFVENIYKSIGDQEILRGVNLHVKPGHSLVIIGRSGEGKSVLLRHLIGLMKPDSGRILVNNQDIVPLSERQLAPLRKKIGILFQDGALFDSMTVAENVAFPLREAGERSQKVIQEKVAEALEVVDLNGQQDKMPVNLSGGMKKRVALARAIAAQPECLLYDEPTAGLDPIVADSIDHLIKRMNKKLNVTNLVVTHDMKSAFFIADHIAYLHNGAIYFYGTPAELQEAAKADPLIYNFINGISEDSQH